MDYNVTTPSEVYAKAKSLHMNGMRSWGELYEVLKNDKDLREELEYQRRSLGDYVDDLMEWLDTI